MATIHVVLPAQLVAQCSRSFEQLERAMADSCYGRYRDVLARCFVEEAEHYHENGVLKSRARTVCSLCRRLQGAHARDGSESPNWPDDCWEPISKQPCPFPTGSLRKNATGHFGGAAFSIVLEHPHTRLPICRKCKHAVARHDEGPDPAEAAFAALGVSGLMHALTGGMHGSPTGNLAHAPGSAGHEHPVAGGGGGGGLLGGLMSAVVLAQQLHHHHPAQHLQSRAVHHHADPNEGQVTNGVKAPRNGASTNTPPQFATGHSNEKGAALAMAPPSQSALPPASSRDRATSKAFFFESDGAASTQPRPRGGNDKLSNADVQQCRKGFRSSGRPPFDDGDVPDRIEAMLGRRQLGSDEESNDDAPGTVGYNGSNEKVGSPFRNDALETDSESDEDEDDERGVVHIMDQQEAENVHLSGYLSKFSVGRSGFFKNWRRRFFVCDGGLLQYFENEQSNKPLGTIDLAGEVGRRLVTRCSSRTHPQAQRPDVDLLLVFVEVVAGSSRPQERKLLLRADNPHDHAQWAVVLGAFTPLVDDPVDSPLPTC
jgi:hypothetical protein